MRAGRQFYMDGAFAFGRNVPERLQQLRGALHLVSERGLEVVWCRVSTLLILNALQRSNRSLIPDT